MTRIRKCNVYICLANIRVCNEYIYLANIHECTREPGNSYEGIRGLTKAEYGKIHRLMSGMSVIKTSDFKHQDMQGFYNHQDTSHPRDR